MFFEILMFLMMLFNSSKTDELEERLDEIEYRISAMRDDELESLR